MKSKYFLFIIGVVLFLNLVSAGFVVGNASHSIDKNYTLGGNITGWINVSFQNESIDTFFTDSFGNSITLEEVLGLNQDYVHNETNFMVDSEFQFLSLNDSFRVLSAPGKVSYKLSFDEKEIFTEDIFLNASNSTQPLGSLKSISKNEIEKKRTALNDLEQQINSLDLLVRLEVDSILEVSSSRDLVDKLDTKFDQATLDSEYQNILDDLSKMDIAISVSQSKEVDRISFIPEKRNIDLDYLTEITEESYDPSNGQSYLDAMLFWGQENLKPKISMTEIFATYANSQEIILKSFEIEYSSPDEDAYLIIEKLLDLKFDMDYSEEDKENYYSINVKENVKSVKFTTTEDVDFKNLPAFISPPLNDLSLGTKIDYIDSEEEKKISKWVLFSLVMFLLLIVAFVIYVVMQNWYKRRYETYLFKNRNNLFNLVNYIHMAKKKGMSDGELARNLRKAKWKGEQVTYAMKKYAGKRTGMVEFFGGPKKEGKINNSLGNEKKQKPKVNSKSRV